MTRKANRPAAKPTETTQDLPPGVEASDLVYPKWTEDKAKRDEVDYKVGESGTLTLLLVQGAHSRTQSGWVVATLSIDNKGRTYGAKLKDGAVVTCGKGPHILKTVTVYVKASNKERLTPIILVYMKGLTEANMIRDRISSRRAEGQVRRANGEHSWLWSR